MKSYLTRFFSMLAVPLLGVLIPVVGYGATDTSEPAVAEEQGAMNAEEESVITEASVLEEAEEAEEAEASEEASFAPPQPRGTCWARRNCREPSDVITRNVTALECRNRLGGRSWRRNHPHAACRNLY